MRKSLLLFLSLILSVSSFAQGKGPQSVVFPFSLVPVDPAVMGANSLLASSSHWAALSNAALVPFSEKQFGVAASYALIGKSSNIAGGLSYNLNNKLGVCAAYSGNFLEPYELINANKVSDGMFTPKNTIVALGLSYRLLDFFSVAVNAKYLLSKLSPSDAISGTAFDATVMYSNKALSAALGVNSLGGGVNTYSLASSLVAGVQYALGIGESSVIELGLEANYYLYGGLRAGANAEYAWNDMIFVRAGYNYSNNAPLPSFASAGLGVKYFGIEINASYRYMQNANAILFGLAASF